MELTGLFYFKCKNCGEILAIESADLKAMNADNNDLKLFFDPLFTEIISGEIKNVKIDSLNVAHICKNNDDGMEIGIAELQSCYLKKPEANNGEK